MNPIVWWVGGIATLLAGLALTIRWLEVEPFDWDDEEVERSGPFDSDPSRKYEDKL